MAAAKPHSSGDDLVVVGKITAPYGIKGWVKVHSFTEPASALFEYPRLLVERGGSWQEAGFDSHRAHGKGQVAHIKGCDDRNQAALFAQCPLAVAASELPDLPADDYYWRDLEGLAVYAATEGEPVLLGRIAHLFATGANDVMVVAGSEGSIDKRERLIPWVPGQHVLEVDIAAGKVLVDWDPEF